MILLVEQRDEEREQARALLGVVGLPHPDLEIREARRVELAHRARATRRRQHEGQREGDKDQERHKGPPGPDTAHGGLAAIIYRPLRLLFVAKCAIMRTSCPREHAPRRCRGGS